jgi:hypothetical protein
MRDLKRIPIIMDDIMHQWTRYPDYRLGQMISNSMNGCGADLFYIEDDDLVERIKNHCKGVTYYGNKDNT